MNWMTRTGGTDATPEYVQSTCTGGTYLPAGTP